MMGQCKIQWTHLETTDMECQAASFIKFMLHNGYHSKKFLDGDDDEYPNVNVSLDTDIGGNVIIDRDTYSLKQMHLQRFVILDHEKIRKVFEDANIEQKRKKEERVSVCDFITDTRAVSAANATLTTMPTYRHLPQRKISYRHFPNAR